MSGELWDFQQAAVQQALAHGAVYNLFMEMGLGKTRTALAIAEHAHAKRVMVVLPISAAGVWSNEVAAVWPDATVVSAVSDLLRVRAQRVLLASSITTPLVVLVNYDAFWREPLRSALRRLKFDMVIYDELHRLKHRGTKCSRFAHQLADEVPMRLGLTGSPLTRGMEDFYSEFRAVAPNVFGRRWVDFQWKYLVMGGYEGREIIGYRNQSDVEQRLAASSYRLTKAEAISLPEEVDVVVPVQLSRRSAEVYHRIKTRAISEVEGTDEHGQPHRGTALARIVLTSVLRLQQVTSGAIKTAPEPGSGELEGRIVDIGSEKLDALRDLLSDVDGRVVVFARFRRDIERLEDLVEQEGRNAYVLDGNVPARVREERLLRWRDDPTGVIVGQIQVTALAMDFTAAHIAVFYSLDFNLVNYIQSRARLHRYGQRNPVTYYHLVADGTVDEKIYAVLRRREDLARTILDDPRGIFDAGSPARAQGAA